MPSSTHHIGTSAESAPLPVNGNVSYPDFSGQRAKDAPSSNPSKDCEIIVLTTLSESEHARLERVARYHGCSVDAMFSRIIAHVLETLP